MYGKHEMDQRRIVLVIRNVRSAHNVGSLLRTAEGLGVEKVYLTGYSPYPEAKNDERLPHVRRRAEAQISKTALGTDKYLKWEHADITDCLKHLSGSGFKLVALEQTADAEPIQNFQPGPKTVLIVGNEVKGLDKEVLAKTDLNLQIPMLGRKESYNVASATAMALYHLRFN